MHKAKVRSGEEPFAKTQKAETRVKKKLVKISQSIARGLGEDAIRLSAID